MTDRDEQPTDILNRALAALRDEPIPEGPPPELAASTLEALRNKGQTEEVWAHPRRKLMFRIARYSGIAAAVASVAAIIGWLILMDRTASLAFADVIEKVKNAESVSFVTKIPTIIRGTKRSDLKQKFYIRGDSYRMEIPSDQEGAEVPPDAPPILSVMLADLKQKKAILLDYTTKTAKNISADVQRWQELNKALADPIKQLRGLKDSDAERLPDEDLNGKKMQVYRLNKKDIFLGLTAGPADTVKLWVDPKTGLPAKIRVDNDQTYCVFEDFTWNPPLDPAMFKLEVPEGFTVKE
jgi:outer membrane lipoprotein-sorting protein